MRPTDRVWIAVTYVREPIFHATDHDRNDVFIGYRGQIGPAPGWVLSRCGKTTNYLQWDAEQQRFYVGAAGGIDVPLRLLNPDVVRPCRRCWPRGLDTS